MKISGGQFFKYFYIFIIILWILISIHIFYLYVDYTSEKKPAKGGTFIEAVFNNINYLPYTSMESNDRFYQSFLFKGCLTPYVNDAQIEYKDDLCKVESFDNKVFNIKLNDTNTWSNGNSITLDDIYFTYNDILINNKWNLPGMEAYKSIQINYTGNNMTVIFPKASIDNKIFFQNYILPKSILAQSNLDGYIDIYRNNQNAVYSNCGKLQANSKDTNSIVFDLTNCNKSYIKYYQIKKFQDFNEFKKYVSDSSENMIDTYINDQTLTGFISNKVILGQFITLFFNTQSPTVSIDTRKAISSKLLPYVYSGNYEQYLVWDNHLFDTKINGGDLKDILSKSKDKLTSTSFQDKNIKDIPGAIDISGNMNLEYYLGKIADKDKFKLNLNFIGNISKGFDKVAIQNGQEAEYVLKSYDAGSKNATYNLSEDLKTIHEGENLYKIKGYSKDKLTMETTIKIHYKKKPQEEIKPKSNDFIINVIYFNDDMSKYIISALKNMIAANGLQDYFNIIGYQSPDEFEGKILSNDYDIVVRGIDLGTRKDISGIFRSDNARINPSNYKNPELADAINQYLNTDNKSIKNSSKQVIDDIYGRNVPFLIIGKTYGIINVREGIDYKYPIRLYDYFFRKDLLGNLILLYKPELNIKKLFDASNIVKFLNDSLKKSRSLEIKLGIFDIKI